MWQGQENRQQSDVTIVSYFQCCVAALLMVSTDAIPSAALAQGALTYIYEFPSKKLGGQPSTPLAIDSEGSLYGVGSQFVFQLTPPAQGAGSYTQRSLYSVKKLGYPVRAALMPDGQGNLYGVTERGGMAGDGSVFLLTPPASAGGSWTETTLHSFQGGQDGSHPLTSLIQDKDGNLFGTTSQGGTRRNYGIVYELIKPPAGHSEWTEVILYRFQGVKDGSTPDSPLVFDTSGSLYGTTSNGGGIQCAGGRKCGTLYKLTPPGQGQAAWTETILYSFRGGDDGEYPSGRMVFDQAGNLYTSCAAHVDQASQIVQLSPPPGGQPPWSATPIYRASGSAINQSDPDLTIDGAGNLFFTYAGGILELSPASSGSGSWTVNPLWMFSTSQGGHDPTGGLVFDSAGALYGATTLGGKQNFGTAFKIVP